MRKNIQRAIKEANRKKIIYISSISIFAILLIVAIFFMIYVININNNNEAFHEIKGVEDGKKELVFTEEASSDIGKSIDDIKKEETENTLKVEKSMETSNNTVSDKLEEIKETEEIKNVNNQKKEEKIEDKEEKVQNIEENNIEPIFSMPIDGEIIKEFAKDKLVYSDTLKEWVTHTGIDIKAEKTSVVKASENGTVKYIKNDPRYGLTVVIEHNMRI